MMKKDDMKKDDMKDSSMSDDKMKKEDMKDSSMMSDSSSEMKDDMKKKMRWNLAIQKWKWKEWIIWYEIRQGMKERRGHLRDDFLLV